MRLRSIHRQRPCRQYRRRRSAGRGFRARAETQRSRARLAAGAACGRRLAAAAASGPARRSRRDRRKPPRSCAQARPMWCCSAPAARAWAARRWPSSPAMRCPASALLRDPPRMHFMDNLDPESFATLLARLPLATTRFVAISKSGGTGETLMQTAAVLAALKQAGVGEAHRRAGARPFRAGERRQAQRPARSAGALRRAVPGA